MANIASIVGAADTVDRSRYTTAPFVSTQGDVLICNILASGTQTVGYVIDDQNLGWTLIGSVVQDGNILVMYKSQNTAQAYSNTVTWDCSDDPATGARVGILAARNSDVAIRQFAVATGLAGTPPAVVMPSAILTGNCALAQVGNLTNPAALTPTTGWTEIADAGWANPTTGFEIQRINSGSTASTVTWGSNSATNWIAMVVEIYNLAATPFIGSANLYHNDEVVNFLINNGFRTQYNDGLRDYFKTIYMDGGDTFQDLFARYIAEFGTTIPPGA